MTQYIWIASGGGDFDNDHNWETLTSPPPIGPPADGDQAIIHFDPAMDVTITVDGDTIGQLDADTEVTFQGDLTVTGVLQGGQMSGTINAGAFEGSTLIGGMLSAGLISGGSDLNGGTVTTPNLVWANIHGGTVTASSIDPAATNVVVVDGGTVSARTLDLDEDYVGILVRGGSLTIGTSTTIDGAAGAPGIAGGILVSGGRLNLGGGLELNGGGAYLTDGAPGSPTVGGTVTTPTMTVGGTGSGRVFIFGSNAHVNVAGDFILGQSGSGSLTVEDGGHLMVGGDFEAAVKSGSTATATLLEPTIDLTFQADWDIGVAGTASLILGSGASATVGGKTELGVSSGGDGTLELSDAGTMVVGGGSVVVAGVGSGTLIVESGAEFDGSAGTLTVAESEKSDGEVDLDGAGAKLVVGSAVVVGDMGSGTIILTGGSATLSSTLTLGETSSGTGGLSVTGAQFAVAGDVKVGESGKGMITVGPDGHIGPGAVSIPAGSTDTFTLGVNSGGKGTLNISGAGATVKSIGLIVGEAGGGTVNIGDHGVLSTTGDATVGEGVTATIQKVTITSAGGWNIGDNLTLGGAAIATTSVTSGGELQVDGNLMMGESADATGILVISGGLTTGSGSSSTTTPSRLHWGGVLDVGEGGTGTLTVTGGAQALAYPTRTGLLEIASGNGAKGTVTVAGASSELIGNQLAVGGDPSEAGGTGTLAVNSGSTAQFAKGGVVWSGGQINVGGTLTIGATTDNGQVNAYGGRIAVTGGFQGTGTVSVGVGGVFTLNASKTSSANKVRIAFSNGVFNLTGGSANDLFAMPVAALTSQDVVAGGAGHDTLQFTTAGTIGPGAFAHVSGIDTIQLAAGVNALTLTNALVVASDANSLTIIGGVGVNTVNAAAVTGSVVFNGVATTQTVFTAGSGTVAVTGGAGADIFRFSATSLKAADLVVGGLGADTLQFTSAGTIQATAFTAVSGIDRLLLASGANSLTIGNALVQHSDGDKLTITGGTGNDTINAAAVSATGTLVFQGGGGADVITGGMGDNIYEVAKTAQTLTIANAFASGTAAHGTLQFDSGLTDQNLWFKQSGNNLVVDVIGTSEQVTLNGWFGANKSAQVAEIQAGGLDLDSGVAKLVSAMAAFQTANPGFNPAASGAVMPTTTTLQNAITAAWHH